MERRHSSSPLVSPAGVDGQLCALCPPAAAESVPLSAARVRVLLEPVRADRDGPPFDRAMLDGIALRVADWTAEGLSVAGSQVAGAPPMKLPPGACCEIMTGAVVPAGADCVVGYEDVTLNTGRAILPEEKLPPGNAIHRRGSDFTRGDVLIPAPALLTSRLLAVAASCGRTALGVARRPRIGILATGDETIPPEQTPQPWQIRRSNATLLEHALQNAGAEIVASDHAPDDPARTLELLRRQLGECEIVVTTGGIALGERDFLPGALAELQARPLIRGVAQRPGKPLGLWQMPTGQLVCTLPGNPMSVAVACSRYLAPFFRRWQGLEFAPETVRLSEPWAKTSPLTVFLPVALETRDGLLRAAPRPLQNSGDLAGAVDSTGFVALPPKTPVAADAVLCYYPWL